VTEAILIVLVQLFNEDYCKIPMSEKIDEKILPEPAPLKKVAGVALYNCF